MDPLACLERLARAAGTSPTLKVVWKRLWEALPPSWDVRCLELVSTAADHAELEVFALAVEAGQPRTWSCSRPGAGSFAAQVFSDASVRVHERDARNYVGAQSGAVALVGFALELAHGQERCVVMHLAQPCSGASPQFMAALMRIFEAAVAHVELVDRVAQLSQRAHQQSHELREELDRLTERPRIVADSPSMRRVVTLAEQVAEHDITVLISGESGTGKELLARHIHTASPRRSSPFVAVNCGALPDALIESELFGHEKGAFTGATARRLGRFERAQRGTIFLDEVGDLPLASQVKLLRVLEERQLERVGGERTLKIDVRVIAATHRPLERMIAEKTFRADLYYRLRGFPLEIPALRERPEDVAAIVQGRLAQLCRRMKRPVPRVAPSTLSALCSAPWPGNVRELENTLERALIASSGAELIIPELPDEPHAALRSSGVETFRAASRRAIEAALLAAGGKIYGPGGAAQLLELKPSTLQTKIQKLSIKRMPDC
jgi:transcriptional regulator with GAF, ATPase, and Fis domain